MPRVRDRVAAKTDDHMSAGRRPLWASYIVAYFLLGLGGTVVDAASGRGGNELILIVGAISCGCGILVFIAALSNSVQIVLKRKPRPRDQSITCAACGYNLTGNVSGVCPECGMKVPA